MLTLSLVVFPVILLLGALAAARLERSLDRPPRRQPAPVTPIEESTQTPLAAVTPVSR
jgi:hypothetical protein